MKNHVEYVITWQESNGCCHTRNYSLWREVCAQLKWCLDMGHTITSVSIG